MNELLKLLLSDKGRDVHRGMVLVLVGLTFWRVCVLGERVARLEAAVLPGRAVAEVKQ